MTKNAAREPRIAVVGAGPSGCFIAGSLRRSLPGARILVVDRLPCPFGLVRYGVASDHQSTKSITRQFDRIFTREGVEFAGNVRVSRRPEAGAVTLEQLAASADAVVLATGLAADRPLEIPGGDLPGVHGSGAVTGVLNSHPDRAGAVGMLAELGERVVIVGLGNVAVDLIRFLAKSDDGFDGSDVNDAALDAYRRAPVRVVEALSRSPIGAAKCDAQMIRELAQISGLLVSIHGDDGGEPSLIEDRAARARVEALRELAESTSASVPAGEARIELRLRFGAAPERVIGEERVEGVRIARIDGGSEDIPADSILSAIGFEADEHSPGLDDPDIAPGAARIRPGLYRVGWFRRGPRGTIPENRADAVAVAAEIVSDLGSGAIVPTEIATGAPFLPAEVAAGAVEYDQWLRIDAHERVRAPAHRVRAKLPSAALMLDAARGSGTTERSCTSKTPSETRHP